MPRATPTHFPLNGLFGIIKPSGPTSMDVLDRLKSLISDSFLFVDEQELRAQRKKAGGNKTNRRNRFKGPKVGQGGTLDPLADGVLVVGVGKGTKKLSKFLECTKEYRTIGLLGCETDSYDSEGARVRNAPWSHVTREDVEKTLDQFRGKIKQIPPIYSALKMDGKPLYEYARENKPLPRPIEARDAEVLSLELVDWQESASTLDVPNGLGHMYKWPTKEIDESKKEDFKKLKELIVQSEKSKPDEEKATLKTEALEPQAESEAISVDRIPPAFTLKMVVSSGTYVRSIVHDIGLALGSAAHVVSLTRTRQGDFSLPRKPKQIAGANSGDEPASASNDSSLTMAALADSDEDPVTADIANAAIHHELDGNCISWEVFQNAFDEAKSGATKSDKVGEWSEWEQKVLESIEEV